MINESDLAYIAGLFDGEGSISYKQYMRKRANNKKAYPTWQIRMEIAMTDQSVLMWVCEVLGVGTVTPKRYKTPYTVGWKKQWRSRCSHQDAYYVARLLWPYAHVKLEGVQKIIEHYASRKLKVKNQDNIVDLETYRKGKNEVKGPDSIN